MIRAQVAAMERQPSVQKFDSHQQPASECSYLADEADVCIVGFYGSS